jgi:hypothetical protein
MSMDTYEASALFPGIYRLHWVEGGSSLAAVGMLHDGTRWFAPINWTGIVQERIACVKWEMVESAEVVIDPALVDER